MSIGERSCRLNDCAQHRHLFGSIAVFGLREDEGGVLKAMFRSCFPRWVICIALSSDHLTSNRLFRYIIRISLSTIDHICRCTRMLPVHNAGRRSRCFLCSSKNSMPVRERCQCLPVEVNACLSERVMPVRHAVRQVLYCMALLLYCMGLHRLVMSTMLVGGRQTNDAS